MIGNDWERLGTIGMVGRYDLAQKSPGGTTWHDRTIGPTYSPSKSKRAQKMIAPFFHGSPLGHLAQRP